MAASPERPAMPVPEDVNSFWYRHDPDARTVVVFVHGILSDSRACWRAGPTGPYWPDLLAADARVETPSIYMGGYTTFAGAGDFKIHDCASELLEDLGLPDGSGRPAPLSAPSIVFVCHSTGGIVVRYMLERHRQRFAAKRLGLVLLASPSLGSAQADSLGLLLAFYNQQLGRQLQTGDQSLFDIDNRFRDVVHKKLLNLTGVEAYEHYFVIRNRLPKVLQNWAPNWGRRVVQPFSAGVYFGAPKQMPRTDHFTIAKPTAITHPSHKLLVAFLTEFAAASAAPAPAPDRARDPRPLPRSSGETATEVWRTLGRIRHEPDTEISRELRVTKSERTIVVRRPDVMSTEVDELVNVSSQGQAQCVFALFTDSPSEFKDLGFHAWAQVGETRFDPAVSVKAKDGGLKFIVTLGFKGKVVPPGGRMTLGYSARFPSAVALNQDYWVFPAEKMRPDATFSIDVKFPAEPADVACYRIRSDESKEPIAVVGPTLEEEGDPPETLHVYRVTPDRPAGDAFVMTWRLENA